MDMVAVWLIQLSWEMAPQKVHLSWPNYVAVRYLPLSNQAKTVCGCSECRYVSKLLHLKLKHIKQKLFQIQIILTRAKSGVPNKVPILGPIHNMWWYLLKWKWCPDLSLSSKCLSRFGQLCLCHISTKWKIYQYFLCHHGHKLQRLN